MLLCVWGVHSVCVCTCVCEGAGLCVCRALCVMAIVSRGDLCHSVHCV